MEAMAVREERANAGHTVPLPGGTGRSGGRPLELLVSRGVNVRAIVRSAGRLPAGVAGRPGLTVVEADLLSMSGDEPRRQLAEPVRFVLMSSVSVNRPAGRHERGERGALRVRVGREPHGVG